MYSVPYMYMYMYMYIFVYADLFLFIFFLIFLKMSTISEEKRNKRISLFKCILYQITNKQKDYKTFYSHRTVSTCNIHIHIHVKCNELVYHAPRYTAIPHLTSVYTYDMGQLAWATIPLPATDIDCFGLINKDHRYSHYICR